MEIGPARPSDVEPLAGLLLAVYQDFGEPVPLLADLVSFLREHVTQPDRLRIVLARNGDELLGMASVAVAPTTAALGTFAWLDDVHVRTEHRGQGIGRLLVRAALAAARDAGAREMRLTVPAGDVALARFYQRQGFRNEPFQFLSAALEPGPTGDAA